MKSLRWVLTAFFFLPAMVIVAQRADVPQLRSASDPPATEKPADLNLQRDGQLINGQYRVVDLKADLSGLEPGDRKALYYLIQAADIANRIFMVQSGGSAYTDYDVKWEKSEIKRLFEINYGPWDRLNNDAPFIEGVSAKPAGAGFYPEDMSLEEYQKWNDPIGQSPYSMVTRNSDGMLQAVPYHQYFASEIKEMVSLLEDASASTTSEEFRIYLQERSKALRTDVYDASDVAWLLMKDNPIDIIIGPIENYEDKLLGVKTSYEAYVLVKDMEWSKRLERYASLLPELQQKLPAKPVITNQPVGSDSQLAAYDVVYYAGDCNSGSKTIAVNLPNDEAIQSKYGTRRSQLKNTMQAKFDHILVPIANQLLDPEQAKRIRFETFFMNVMFHEVAHGLGVKSTNRGLTPREALKEQHSWIEEEKADVLGLWLIAELYRRGEIKEGQMMDHYITFLAGILRSSRFGASSAHGLANMHTFNFLMENKAIYFNAETGKYGVNEKIIEPAIEELASQILTLQFSGNYDYALEARAKATMPKDLSARLAALSRAGIPVDIVFNQGLNLLGL